MKTKSLGTMLRESTESELTLAYQSSSTAERKGKKEETKIMNLFLPATKQICLKGLPWTNLIKILRLLLKSPNEKIKLIFWEKCQCG